MNRTCRYDKKPTDAEDDIDKKINELDFNKLVHISKLSDAFEQLNFAFLTSQMTFVKCWWNKAETVCSDIVLTIFNDCVIGYTINANMNIAKNFLERASGKRNE